jgi:hypothetical protein
MTIRFECAGCRSSLSAPEGRALQQATCPNCGAKVTVPANVVPTPAVESHAKDLGGDQNITASAIRPTVLNLDRLVRETSRIFRSNWHLIISVSVLITLGELAATFVGALAVFGLSNWPLGSVGVAVLLHASYLCLRVVWSIDPRA